MTGSLNKTGVFCSLQVFWKLLAKEILNEKKRLLPGSLLALLTGIFSIMIPTFIQMIIDNAIPAKNTTLLGYYVIGLLSAIILICCVWYIQVSLNARASENIFYNFKIRLSDSLLRKHLSFYSHYLSSDLLTRIVADLNLVSEFFKL
ncbi:MAG: hypothetical protein HQK55_06875 [Deltaproteobacteria bacterium]|nr:hypothetical protein [Deltaproteobacteria bacterium]